MVVAVSICVPDWSEDEKIAMVKLTSIAHRFTRIFDFRTPSALELRLEEDA